MNVRVQFSPRLDPADIREEALRLSREELVRQAEEAARLEKERLELEQQLAAVRPQCCCMLRASTNSNHL